MLKIIKYILIIIGIIGLVYYFGSPKIREWLTHQEKTISEKIETKIEDGKDKFDENKDKIKDKLEDTKEKVEDKINDVIKK